MQLISFQRTLLLAAITLLYCVTTCANDRVAPYFSIRSQGVDMPRHLVGMNYNTYAHTQTPYGLISFAPAYSRSFNSDHITRCLFGNSLYNHQYLTISGSSVANRGAKDLLADYFYLPSDFKSTVCFNPVIDNFIIDCNLYISLDKWVKNTYCALYTPLVHSRWFLNLHESVQNYGVQPYPAGVFTQGTLNRGSLLENFTSYVCGGQVQPIPNETPTPATTGSTSSLLLTIMQQLKNSKMRCQRLDATRVADVRVYIGWNIKRENYHIGLIIETAIPTGSRPQGIYLFEPIIGNGNNWELGAGIEGHYDLWCNESDTARLNIYARTDITHIFGTKQTRTFDLCGKPLSRYMLAQKMSTTQNNLQGGGTVASAQFQQEFAPIANLSTIHVKTSADVQAEFLCMLHADVHNWSIECGYNLWARTREKIKELGLNILDKNSTWALKGDARVFGFASAADAVSPTLNTGQAVALSATQSEATLHAGLNGTNTVNTNIDKPQLAFAGGTPTALNNTPTAGTQINTSIQPIFIQETDLNISGAETRGLSNSLFVHVNYTGAERQLWVPHVGLGAKAEVGYTHSTCHDALRCSLSQWELWIKAGFSFK